MSNIPGTLRAVIYARLSKNRHGLSTNTKIQVAECRQELGDYAEGRGLRLDVVAVFEEDDVSASRYSAKPRPLYEQMLQLVKSNKVDMVWATEPERLLRRPEEMSTLIDLAEITDLRELRFTSDEGYNLSTPDGIYSARGAANRGERESRKISVRTKRKQADRARNGLPHGGHRPFGYEPGGMKLREDEAAVLRRMADMVIHGRSVHDVTAWLRHQGITTAEGKQWFPVTVRNTLQRVRYAGIRTHLGVNYPAVWEPVFDQATWETLQLTMKLSRERYNGRAAAGRYLLTGLLECGSCGQSLNGETKRDKPGRPLRRVYTCRGCRVRSGTNGVIRGAEPLEHLVKESVIFRLDTPELGKLLRRDDGSDQQVRDLLERRSAQQVRIDELVASFSDVGLSLQELGRAKAAADAVMQSITDKLDALARSRVASVAIPAGQCIREVWDTCDSDSVRRELIRLGGAEKIVVHPGNTKPFYSVDETQYRFDPNLIEILWRE